jgi:endo-beta-N-acetylglucosaminidase D
MDSLLMWFKDGVPTDLSRLRDLEFKRSHVRPRAVIVDRATQLDTSIDPRRSVFANLPIGSTDRLTGLPSGNFDEDVFSVWPYVKVHGNWSNPLFTAPAAYTDAAHRHGTAVLSSWFFSWYWEYAAGKSKAEDGNSYKVDMMTKKDDQGNFIYAEPMINIMQYFGMDGINYNSECLFKGSAAGVQALHKKLYDIAREKNFSTFHVGWYNGAGNDGKGRGGRSRLDDSNDRWFYNNGKFVSDAFMLDYAWSVTSLTTTVGTADSIGAPNGALDVYGGMWLVDIQKSYFPALDIEKEVSIGLWGEHKSNRFFNHRSGDDLAGIQKSYQDRLEWFFTGKTKNPLDAKSNAIINGGGSVGNDSYLQAFHGIARHVAERSSVQGSLPFATNFNLGNGVYYYDRSVKTLGQWYNLSAQDMIPTYRWLIADHTGAAAVNVKARFSHEDAWVGGSSLLLEGTAKATPTDITLYRTLLGTKKNDAYSAKPVTPKNFSVEPYSECATKLNLKMVWSMSDDNSARLVYNDEVNVDHFEIFVKRTGEAAQQVATTASWAHFLPNVPWENATEQSFEVGVRAVAQDLTTVSEVAWATVKRNPAAATVSCGGGGDYCEAVSYVTEGNKNAPDNNWFKTVTTTGADHNISLTGKAANEENALCYSAFSGDTIRVKPGQTFKFRANETVADGDVQNSLRWCTYRIWVDWNRDRVFAPIAERIAEDGQTDSDNPAVSPSVGNTSVVKIDRNITVPAGAAPGLTCMRIRYSDAWGPRPAPCGNILGGYTADIYILVEGKVVEPEPEPDPVPPAFKGAALNMPYPSAYLVYKLDGGAAGSTSNLALLLKKKGASAPVAYPLGNAALEGWNEATIPLTDYAETDTIVSVGLRVQSAAASAPVRAYVGELRLLPGTYKQQQKITVSVTPAATDFTITSAVLLVGTDTMVNYGNPLVFTFKVPAGQIPAVKINGAPVSYSHNTGTGVCTVSLPSVTEDLSIAITAAAPHTVTVAKPEAVEVISASAPTTAQPQQYKVASGNAFALTFRIDGEGYDVPKVTINGAPYVLTPAVGGVYTVAIAAVSADMSIAITPVLRRLVVSVTAGSHVALQTAARDTVEWGKSSEVRFTLEAGYNPVVTINNVNQPAPTAGAGGAYTVAIPNVTTATSVSVSAALQQLDVTLSRGANIVLGSGTTEGAKKVGYGGYFAFSFRVVEGYQPVLKVNNVEVALGAPSAAGLYRDTVYNITAATTINISVKLDDDPTGVEPLAADAPRFFPNPASDVVTFENTEKVSIYTVSGTLVGVYTEATISIAHLPAGIYVLKMQRGGYTRAAQLVKK